MFIYYKIHIESKPHGSLKPLRGTEGSNIAHKRKKTDIIEETAAKVAIRKKGAITNDMVYSEDIGG